MTCNFKNSAGTDLDDLFYTNNGNAGALGFKNSSGTDLGNKYTNASTLGYAVGYKNSAGTDMGYLRGNLTTVDDVTTSTDELSYFYNCGWCYESACESRFYDFEYSATITFDQDVTTVRVSVDAGSHAGGCCNWSSAFFLGNTASNADVEHNARRTFTVNGKSMSLFARGCNVLGEVIGYRYTFPVSLTFEITNAAGTSTITKVITALTTSCETYDGRLRENCGAVAGG